MRGVVRRTVFLLIGGAVAVAFALLAVTLLGAFSSGTQISPWAFIPLALVPMALVGFLPGVREVEVAAADSLLGTRELVVPEPMRREHRWRTALWTFVHEIIGFLTGVAVVVIGVALASPLVLVSGQSTLQMTGWALPRPSTALAWLLLGLLVAALVATAIAFIVGAGVSATWAAPLLLGPIGSDRLALAEQQLRREQEYRRLSRDLHDGVGHALSGISLQAAAGRRVLARDPERASDALAAIERLASTAAGELDHALGVLRDGVAPRHPEPGTAQLDTLVAAHRQLGMTVHSTVELHGEVPSIVDATAYRICAEGLSNAAKHGAGGEAVLEVRAQGSADLDVRVANPLGRRARGARRVGRGLDGLRERVDLLGGTLDAGPVGEQWVLRARLPMGERNG